MVYFLCCYKRCKQHLLQDALMPDALLGEEEQSQRALQNNGKSFPNCLSHALTNTVQEF